MLRRVLKWSSEKRSAKERAIALAVGAVVFGFLIPSALIAIGSSLDSSLGFSIPLPLFVRRIIGLFLILIGWPFALWAVFVQYRVGGGTPLPMAPTQKLATSGPYKYCRNPMALGTLLFYSGLFFLFGIASALVILTPAIFVPILVYVKLVEEKELEIRFGAKYLEYKRRTPFLIPRIRR